MTKRRWHVLASAAACFAARGYHGVGMRELAQAAGLNPGTLYHHFESKDHVLQAICLIGHQRTRADLERVLAEARGLEARLRLLFRLHVETLGEIGDFMQVYINLREFVSPERAAPLRQGWELHKARQRTLFQDAIAAGEIEPNIDVRHAGRMLTGAIRIVNQLHRAGRGDEVGQFSDFAQQVLTQGLLRRRPQA
jgi:TetR/AcrR family transcriptional regulator, cholesterol catabolism regulator